MSNLLQVSGLSIEAVNAAGALRRVVEGISFSIESGRILALVGESGSGKSLTALSLLGLLPSGVRVAEGSIKLRGRELLGMSHHQWRTIRGCDVGMIFQEPMTALNPVFSIGEQVAEVLRHHGRLDRRNARREAVDLLERVAIPEPGRCARSYPHELSGGMRQRVVAAMAIAANPSILVADEPTTALDIGSQNAILDLIEGFARADGLGVLLISHDLALVEERADHVCVLYQGHVCETGPVEAVTGDPRHPYTRGLLSCTPRLSSRSRTLPTIEEVVEDPSSECVDTDAGRFRAWWPGLPGGYQLESIGPERLVGVRQGS
ncbi:MAG: ABC transporter ATP-binding protein [Planctomycetota bacterium]|nr:ABC transporter ATP-binding protein [Planctomycetota bacterium]